ncbi:hypothetical protein INT43_001163 [Umbelopsis isabellina]|uniref:Uncharacterized protein n=1 Tax=Mortierella isabellina TaxID=91625 RepID=A0A8H7PLP4_MORIS|nr:hypothetical protein INT43_001163 [Umbelopsis isabellina]
MPWPSLFGSKAEQKTDDSTELVGESRPRESTASQPHGDNELGQRNEDMPMSLQDAQDIMNFKFVTGRPIMNFILAVLWSIGLPILLYRILQPRIGQVAGMIIASLPPLAIVVWRMWKTRTPDPLGLVMGVSFFISGLLSIAQPDQRWQLLGESVIPLMLGLFCLASLLPWKFGRHNLQPLVFQIVRQIMPRGENDDEDKPNESHNVRQTVPQHVEDESDTKPKSKNAKLQWLYINLPKFRRDMRVLTAVWGVTLMLNFVVKICLITSPATTDQVRNWGYAELGIVTVITAIFTFFYTGIVASRTVQDFMEKRVGISGEAVGRTGNFAQGVDRDAHGFSNMYGQIMN